MPVARKLVRHETPAWCRRTAQADETVIFDVVVVVVVLKFPPNILHIFTPTRNLELAVHSEIPGGLCQEGRQRRKRGTRT